MRKSWDQHFMNIAREVASMGTCARRQVGCVLVDEDKVILATGFNGVPATWPHCRDADVGEFKCPGVGAMSGTNLDMCFANHGEANALLHCTDVMKIHTAYCTTSPCVGCTKLLLCTSAKRIVFDEDYTQPEAMGLWVRYSYSGVKESRIWGPRTWEKLKSDGTTLVVDSSGFKH